MIWQHKLRTERCCCRLCPASFNWFGPDPALVVISHRTRSYLIHACIRSVNFCISIFRIPYCFGICALLSSARLGSYVHIRIFFIWYCLHLCYCCVRISIRCNSFHSVRYSYILHILCVLLHVCVFVFINVLLFCISLPKWCYEILNSIFIVYRHSRKNVSTSFFAPNKFFFSFCFWSAVLMTLLNHT